MNIQYEDEDIKIQYEIGDCPKAVVAFGGVSYGLGGIEITEFSKSLSNIKNYGKSCSIAYIIDKKRQWYNGYIKDKIVDNVNYLINKFEASDTVTLGNSMGGFGAIVFAQFFAECRKAIAFCPQSTINKNIAPFENRWEVYTSAIESWVFPDATKEISNNVVYNLYFGDEDKNDKNHQNRFEELSMSNIIIHSIKGCGHNVAAYLKEQNLLPAILRNGIWGDIITDQVTASH